MSGGGGGYTEFPEPARGIRRLVQSVKTRVIGLLPAHR